jgi:hypothetical protein
MKGRKLQSLSTAGSVPSGTPNQLSISGPLPSSQRESKHAALWQLFAGEAHQWLEGAHLAWWKPTTHMAGAHWRISADMMPVAKAIHGD